MNQPNLPFRPLPGQVLGEGGYQDLQPGMASGFDCTAITRLKKKRGLQDVDLAKHVQTVNLVAFGAEHCAGRMSQPCRVSQNPRNRLFTEQFDCGELRLLSSSSSDEHAQRRKLFEMHCEGKVPFTASSGDAQQPSLWWSLLSWRGVLWWLGGPAPVDSRQRPHAVLVGDHYPSWVVPLCHKHDIPVYNFTQDSEQEVPQLVTQSVRHRIMQQLSFAPGEFARAFTAGYIAGAGQPRLDPGAAALRAFLHRHREGGL
eukprot:RCo010983